MTAPENNPDNSMFGPAWRGWERYNAFAQSVKSHSRFVRSQSANDFLELVGASSLSRQLTIPKGRIYWRARIGCDTEEISHTEEGSGITAVVDEDRPFTAKDMKPIPNWDGEGRANPRGIPFLYLATTRDTALSEIRPWVGATISVAQFETIRDLKVIDCSRHKHDGFIKVLGNHTMSEEDGIWIAIDGAFATPVSKEFEARDYIPTQIVAELFKSSDFDGIVYKSLLSEDGFNLALFNLDDAQLINCSLFSTKSISFEFSDMGCQYFTSPKK